MTCGKVLKKGDIVVYESTVYPGVTEEECAPVLQRISGLKCGTDFKLGYSPARINPGDKEHTFTRIRKVVSGQDAESLGIVATGGLKEPLLQPCENVSSSSFVFFLNNLIYLVCLLFSSSL